SAAAAALLSGSSFLMSAVSLPGTPACPGFVSADDFRLLKTPVMNGHFCGQIRNDDNCRIPNCYGTPKKQVVFWKNCKQFILQ
uniref:Uncharacterized protein n=1 Tax=Junco hyemalis TaxID=40217 RepID=A0A8C5JDR5_JUNHY